MDIPSDLDLLGALAVDCAFGLAAGPWLWYWGSMAAAEHFWASAPEWDIAWLDWLDCTRLERLDGGLSYD